MLGSGGRSSKSCKEASACCWQHVTRFAGLSLEADHRQQWQHRGVASRAPDALFVENSGSCPRPGPFAPRPFRQQLKSYCSDVLSRLVMRSGSGSEGNNFCKVNRAFMPGNTSCLIPKTARFSTGTQRTAKTHLAVGCWCS